MSSQPTPANGALLRACYSLSNAICDGVEKGIWEGGPWEVLSPGSCCLVVLLKPLGRVDRASLLRFVRSVTYGSPRQPTRGYSVLRFAKGRLVTSDTG